MSGAGEPECGGSGHTSNDAINHQRTENPAQLFEARREVGDLDRTALVIEQPRNQDRGVFDVLLFAACIPVDGDLESAPGVTLIGPVQ